MLLVCFKKDYNLCIFYNIASNISDLRKYMMIDIHFVTGTGELTEKYLSYAEAAMFLYGQIRVRHDVTLLSELIITRDKLCIEMDVETLTSAEIFTIEQKWKSKSTIVMFKMAVLWLSRRHIVCDIGALVEATDSHICVWDDV